MSIVHQPLVFACLDAWLVGTLTRPATAATRGVVIAVGGPQYRAGSHRQFKLLADHLAGRGYAVMRFDYRGMGDSSGAFRGFEDAAPDLRSAIDELSNAVPTIQEFAIWGLCDAASTACLYAGSDERVKRLVLLNPWVRTTQGEAQAYLADYYMKRLIDPAMWRKAMNGSIDIRGSSMDLLRKLRAAVVAPNDAAPAGDAPQSSGARASLPERMASGLAAFAGDVLLILSGNDLVAAEFERQARASRAWRAILNSPRVTTRRLKDATHTFSRAEWRAQVATWTADWLDTIDKASEQHSAVRAMP